MGRHIRDCVWTCRSSKTKQTYWLCGMKRQSSFVLMSEETQGTYLSVVCLWSTKRYDSHDLGQHLWGSRVNSPAQWRHNMTFNHSYVEESHAIHITLWVSGVSFQFIVKKQLHYLLIKSLPFLQFPAQTAPSKRLNVGCVLRWKSFPSIDFKPPLWSWLSNRLDDGIVPPSFTQPVYTDAQPSTQHLASALPLFIFTGYFFYPA